jgi:hypothetical protein
MACERALWCAPFSNDGPVELLDRDSLRSEHGSLAWSTVWENRGPLSCSQTVICLGAVSWGTPFSGKKPPPADDRGIDALIAIPPLHATVRLNDLPQ